MSPLPAPESHITLGASNLQVSRMAWGMWRFAGTKLADAQALVEAAIAHAMTFLDTADIYGFKNPQEGFGDAEALLGDVFRAQPNLRAHVFLATKAGIIPLRPYDSSASYLQAGLEASLRRLNTDHIDLWQIHRPDILTHPQEVARVLDDAVRSGKVRAIGVSNYTQAQLEALHRFLDVPLATTQPEISPLHYAPVEDGTLDQAMRLNLRPLAWSPLAGGRLAGDGAGDAAATRVIAALDKIAHAQSVGRTAVILAWLMAHPAGIIPIIGTQNPARIAEAAQAMNVRFTRQEWYEVLVAARGAPLP